MLHPEAGSGIVQDILNHPGDYYINVHNPDYPAGAIRGQLEYVEDEVADERAVHQWRVSCIRNMARATVQYCISTMLSLEYTVTTLNRKSE